MRIRVQRSWVLLLVALGLGGMSAFGVKRYIEQHVAEVEERSKAKSMVQVLVPKKDLVKGAILSAELVAVREVPSDWAHSNALTPAQFDRIEGQALAYPAVRGEMLMWSMLEGQRAPSFSTRLPNGRRAITVPVDEVNSISGLLQPGDRIDLMVSAKKDGKSYLFPLLQNVAVLATGAQAVPDGKEGSKSSFSTITLDAAPEDARRVLAAREVGKLAAMLRSPGDSVVLPANRQDALSLLGLGENSKESGIPVLYGGRGAAQSAEAQRALNALAPSRPDNGNKP
ncbi:Flp pilus assembly protein CpaB [Paucibacter sp. DJ1R-11]|uniref:Flp pilus assembly protein CpaB n=1 Tax=Paucibacter sp. DJ1R-11 TaxID=2893556 RepID=UPI0021E50056|nr:Flp pilus assembly protein CpaB [Paucibacter sp. DJ1R-11]MCV2365035.1 Flp pilus assembly protein CpaB [Paucibacter sp. DJ1R-11]